MKQALFCAGLFFAVLLVITSCDSATEPNDLLADPPAVTSLEVNPDAVNFTADNDGFKDTTLVISISAHIEGVSDEILPQFSVTRKGESETLLSDELISTGNDNQYQADFEYNTNTTTFSELIINVFAYNTYGDGNYAQFTLDINALSNFRPVVLEASNPEEYQRPSSGTETVRFQAKVTDQDGQSTIEGVFLRLISRVSGEVNNSPFQLFDNGTQGDEAAGDSLFTTSFSIGSENELQTYDVLYYAVDKGGLVSDTVKTTFTIVDE